MPKKITKDKLKTSPFVKKYKEELIRHEDRLGEWYETRQDTSPLNKKVMGSSKLEGFSCVDDITDSANQVKSWKRGPIGETVNLTYTFLAFIIGFSLCAVVMTPIIINSI